MVLREPDTRLPLIFRLSSVGYHPFEETGQAHPRAIKQHLADLAWWRPNPTRIRMRPIAESARTT